MCWVRCGITLRPEISGKGSVQQLLARHAKFLHTCFGGAITKKNISEYSYVRVPHARAAGRHRGGEERAAERSRRRAAAPPHDAVRVPLRCVPCSRARRRRVRRALRGSPRLVRRQGGRGGSGLKTLLRGVRLGHGAL